MTREGPFEEIAQLIDRRVSAEELRAALTEPLSDEEREEILELVRWFCRRYPTALERSAYVRQAYRRWTAARRFASDRVADS
jgi:hypothetical protein